MRPSKSADAGPRPSAGRSSPQRQYRRRPTTRQIVQFLVFVAAVAGVFGLLPRLLQEPPALSAREEVVSGITEYEADQIEPINSAGLTPVVFIHGLRLLPYGWGSGGSPTATS
jgi:hypothetical protein